MGGMVMACMKCGRELEFDSAFCSECLLDMNRYPVAPGTAVHIPIRKETPTVRKPHPKRRVISPEERILRLKKLIWFLTVALVITMVLAGFMIYPTVNYFQRKYHLRPGQNYSTITATTAPTTAPEAFDPLEGFAD